MDNPLQGSLVRLRAREPEIVPFAHEWSNDPEVIRWLGARYPRSRAMTATQIAESTFGPQLCVFGIDSLVDGAPIGWTGLHGEALENRSASLGIALGDKRRWQGGYGADAMRVVCRFGFEMMNLNRIHLEVFPENESAIRCYQRVGFTTEARTRDAIFKHGAFHDLIQMSVLAGELR
ncbi:MAG: GNAT family protein [Tepidiformaceae bacterium]